MLIGRAVTGLDAGVALLLASELVTSSVRHVDSAVLCGPVTASRPPLGDGRLGACGGRVAWRELGV